MDYVEVEYDGVRWGILESKRGKALRVMRALETHGLPVITHGSIARGDVGPRSDVDVVVTEPVAPLLIELYLERAGLKPRWKEIVQATPGYTPKVYLYLDYEGEVVVSYPLARLASREREFYKWGGELGVEGLERGLRVPGVDKRLMLIEPTERGHRESPVVGREGEVARLLGISVDTVLERVRVLTRRRIHGRTGVFLHVELDPEEPVEEAVRELARRNPAFKRALMRSR